MQAHFYRVLASGLKAITHNCLVLPFFAAEKGYSKEKGAPVRDKWKQLMKWKNTVRPGSVFMALVLTVLMLITPTVQVFAETPQEKLDRLTAELGTIKDSIAANEKSIQGHEQNKQYYQQQATNLASQIELMKQKIAETKTALDAKQTELANKVLEVHDTQTLFDSRMVEMYTSRNDDPLSIMLGASSFAAALRYSENLSKIAESDTNLIILLKTQQAELEIQKVEFEQQLAEQQANEAALEQLRVDYMNSIKAADAAISTEQAEMESNEAAYGQTFEETQRAKQELNAWITQNNAKVDFEFGGGVFVWPCPGYNRISSQYGNRILFGKPDFHRGVDMSAAAGTPIYAAAAGVVSTTAHWSYGICVKINHGSGLLTVYGHMLQRVVSDGQTVAAGELIGYVGSTGNSYGNHLHFEVNQNGSVVSPWSFLNG